MRIAPTIGPACLAPQSSPPCPTTPAGTEAWAIAIGTAAPMTASTSSGLGPSVSPLSETAGILAAMFGAEAPASLTSEVSLALMRDPALARVFCELR